MPHNKLTKNSALTALFNSCLSLIGFDRSEPDSSDNKDKAASGTNAIGVLTCTVEGIEIGAHGNVEACQKFIREVDLYDLVERAPNAEIFDDGLIVVSKSNEAIRLLHLNRSTILNTLGAIAPDTELSSAEYHLLMQILSGDTLKEASVKDQVAYETKRSQFKSLSARIGLRTQSEVIRVFLLGLSVYVPENLEKRPQPEPVAQKPDHDFLNLYYPDVFRIHKITTGANRVLRVIETGPIDGTPVIFLHSQTLPQPSQFAGGWLHENNIRLIIPLRPGLLDEQSDLKGLHKHLEASTRELVDTIRFFCGEKARLVAQSTGAAYAINLCRLHPKCVSHLTFSGAAYLGKHDNKSIESLVWGLKEVAARSSFLAGKVYNNHLRKMRTKTGFQTIIDSAYGNSPSDMKIFDDIFTSPLGHSWMYESYKLSGNSVINDVIMPSLDVWKGAEQVNIPTLFLHGKSDPVNVIEDARKISSRFKNSKFIEYPDEGQSLFLSKFEDIITIGHKE